MSRDPNRIDGMIGLLRRVWKRNPDLRLCQLVVNLADNGHDPYHVEDDAMSRNMLESLAAVRGRDGKAGTP